jgi:hypothetical protein
MSFVQKNTVTAGLGVTSLSSSLTGVTAGNLVILTIAWDVNGGSTGPSLDGTAVAAGWLVAENPAGVVSTGNSGWDTGVSIFYLQNAASGTRTVNVTFPNSTRANTLLSEFSGYATSGAKDQVATNNVASGTSLTVTSGTTTVATELVIAAVAQCFVLGNGNNTVSDPPTGYTSLAVLQDTNTYASFEFAYKEVSSTGTQSATWTWASTGEGIASIATFSTSTVTDTLFAQAIL